MTVWTFLNPWGFAALSGLLAVGIIYLFYQRFRRKPVTGLFLWEAPPRPARGGRKISTPTASRSLLLDLAAVLFLVLALTAPAMMTTAPRGLVIILDNSLSMRAGENDKKVRQEALELLTKRENTGGTVVMTAGTMPVILLNKGTGERIGDMETILDNYEPYDPSDSLDKCMALADEMVPGPADIHIFTDHEITHDAVASRAGDNRVFVHVTAVNAANYAIVDAVRRVDRDKGTEKIMAGIANFSGSPGKTGVVLLQGDREIHRRWVSLGPGEASNVVFELEPGMQPLGIELTPPAGSDALAEDSRALLLPERGLPVSYDISLTDRETAEAVQRALDACGGTVAIKKEPALMITDVNTVKNPANPGEKEQKVRGTVMTLEIPRAKGKRQSAFLGPYVVDLAHPLCRDLELTGVYWGPVSVKENKSGAVSLVEAGNVPLYYFSGPGRLVLNIRAASSNILRHPAWPVMFANLVQYCRQRLPGLHKINYSTGGFLHWNQYKQPERNPNRLKGEGMEQPLFVNTPVARVPSKPGIYSLSNNNGLINKIAVNACARSESDLRHLSKRTATMELTSEQKKETPGRKHATSMAWIFLLLAALAMVSNWWLGLKEI